MPDEHQVEWLTRIPPTNRLTSEMCSKGGKVKKSPAHRAAISRAKMGVTWSGSPQTPEHRAKIGAAARARAQRRRLEAQINGL